MRGNQRCDEILRLIDSALDVEVPVARRVAPPAPPTPAPIAPTVAHPASRSRQRWLRRLHRPGRPDARFVAPPAARPSGPVRFAAGLRTAGDLARGSVAGGAPDLPEAG